MITAFWDPSETVTTVCPAPPTRGETKAGLPPAFAHRVATEDVLVTGWQRHSTTDFSVDLDWSGAHAYFAPARGNTHHHMLVAQTLRQVGLGLAHAELGVPQGHHFLLNDLSYSLDPRHRTDTTTPVTATVEYTWTGRRGLEARIDLCQGERRFAVSRSGFTWVPDAVYRRLRGDFLTARPGPPGTPLPAASVGRTAPDEVALAPTGLPHRWELIHDTGHPALIDHPVDHVPGLVLLEAAQQAAYAFADGAFDPADLALEAHRYVEFEAPCLIEAREAPAPAGTLGIEVTGRQRGEVTFRCRVQGSRTRD
ncbi:ScbA/BarX family gamma-butyrolactone biosynthesis protein [Streptomyces sp. NPDC006617]|uniref:ScbA/BarX family gamma-butyrolactone biosynthesis protein n=1 Tax=Streptomyces sp. NPDC006617 TaxID=3155354 RepID=UPI00339F2B65